MPEKVSLIFGREGISGDQLKVDVADILSYNDDLARYVEENPSESLPLVRLTPQLKCIYQDLPELHPAAASVCNPTQSWLAEWIKYISSHKHLHDVQLEEAASNLRRKQAHNQDGDDAEIDLPDLQVLLYSSRQFGPSSIRELTVSINDIWRS